LIAESEAARQITAIARRDGSRLLAALIGVIRDFELAEDALQDAYASALVHWGPTGLPENPQGWLMQVARRKAIDRLRRASNLRSKEDALTHLLQIESDAPESEDGSDIPDERLRMIFTCCHPALNKSASVALTLRTLCGLATEEIARAFVVSRETMAQRIVRAQRKIAAANIPYEVPDPAAWPERLEAVLEVIYLIFNEGYSPSSSDMVRSDLCEEAIRLARILKMLVPDEPEVEGLLALMLLHRARFATRMGSDGITVSLKNQDRSRWDRGLIAEGTQLVETALRRARPGLHQLQAAIAAIHCNATDFANTDWHEITLLYDALSRQKPNPVFELNRIVALSYATDALTALQALVAVEDELAAYQPFHATHADLLARAGDREGARDAYDRALAMTVNAGDRAFLEKAKARL
jgi:RNA polymerase sigma-70 factor, ECF subfamily